MNWRQHMIALLAGIVCGIIGQYIYFKLTR
jgi:hypothetical protein